MDEITWTDDGSAIGEVTSNSIASPKTETSTWITNYSTDTFLLPFTFKFRISSMSPETMYAAMFGIMTYNGN